MGTAGASVQANHGLAGRKGPAAETELVHSYGCVSAGPFQLQASEIDELRFWTRAEIEAALGSGVLTPNFEHEYGLYCLGLARGRSGLTVGQ